ncbi:MAG TPA: cation:proton antiporter [Opitutaceae bacterium]|nr:cation:proton antiporter [Opitutaceae bacterium]
MHGLDFIQDLAVVMLVAGLVGWLCHRLGLSTVVGFLAAGMIIGPHTPPFSLVTNESRIETLAQLGLVFLMFAIGTKLSLRKLRRLGWPLVAAAFVTAITVYTVSRLGAPLFGIIGTPAIFLGAMLVVSSSAIISKVLQETGLGHEKAGQMAMGITVLEDVVAVICLALLNSVVLFGGGAGPDVGETLGLLSAFVALAGIIGLLAVPWLLRKLGETASEELQTLMVAGLMLGLAFIAQRAGYSLAMGAFILGSIVAETPHRGQIDRVFEGTRDMFTAVFFVSIGMQIDVKLLGATWLPILGISLLAVAARVLGGTLGMLVTGMNLRDAVRVGLLVMPIGEFSFIIAQLGVGAGVVSDRFQALAVGLALVTALLAPVFARRSGAISERLDARQPRWLMEALRGYQSWLERLREMQKRSLLWQLSRKRVVQIGLEVLLVTGLLVFSEQIFRLVMDYLPGDLGDADALRLLFWCGLVLAALVPLVAIWRNVAALAMIVAEVSTQGQATAARMKPIVETGLKIAGGVLMFFWLGAVLPAGAAGRWIPLVALAVAAVALYLLRGKLIYWHSLVEVELQSRLEQSEAKSTATSAPWLAQHSEWQLALTECMLPDLADVRGRTIGELGLRSRFGCTIAGIERQGVMVGNPSPATALFPRDKVLLLGDPKQTAAGKAFLTAVTGQAMASNFDEVRMDLVELPVGSRLAGWTLAEAAPMRKTGVQVAGINRGGLRILGPAGEEKLLALDQVLVLGSPDQIRAFKEWAREGAD